MIYFQEHLIPGIPEMHQSILLIENEKFITSLIEHSLPEYKFQVWNELLSKI